ncbi:MAG: hypothetical protein WBV82_11075 [Myxococcaceae bacterium]
MATRGRMALLGAGGAALLAGLWMGLARIGAVLPVAGLSVMDHGPLMVSGFLGTVIALERAVAARTTWGYAAPLFNALGTLAVLASDSILGPVLLALGSVAVVAILVRVVWMDHGVHHLVMLIAAAAWVAGNGLLVFGRPVFDVVGCWLAFIILTIASERLELNRLLRPTRFARFAFAPAVALLLAGVAVAFVARDLGFRLLGAGSLSIAAWLVVNDVARRTVRQTGAVRFIAVSLLSGHLWLGVGGALALWYGGPYAGPSYDALLHAVFVGFVFSMIFGHALVIVPAVLGIRVQYRARFYVHLALLHASLVLRIVGDLAGSSLLRQVGAWANVAALLLFVFNTVRAAQRSPTTSPLRSHVRAGQAI